MNKSRNGHAGDGANGAPAAGTGLEPLNARSIMLSALLGTHPPELPTRALLALTEQFGIRSGTARTALSRLSAGGDVISTERGYALTGRLVERQQEQDLGRRAPHRVWTGEWRTVIAAADRRSMAERRAFRTRLTGARFAELRPDIWLRPANIELASPPSDVIVTTGRLQTVDELDLVARLWPLRDLDDRAAALLARLEAIHDSVRGGDPDALVPGFVVSAAAVRFLRTEPQLPTELQPPRWRPPEVRTAYDQFEGAFQALLRSFFAAVE